MTYRNDLTALSARKTALEDELRSRQRELDDASRMVDELEHRVRLPVLDNLKVAAPCSASWGAMTGDDRVRACGDCKKNVYNLSEMTREDAEALIIAKEGKLCVRYFQRADGTIMLKDCAVGVRIRRRRRHRNYVAAGIAATFAVGIFGIFERATFRMGMMARPEPHADHFVLGKYDGASAYYDDGGHVMGAPAPLPPAPPAPPAPPTTAVDDGRFIMGDISPSIPEPPPVHLKRHPVHHIAPSPMPDHDADFARPADETIESR